MVAAGDHHADAMKRTELRLATTLDVFRSAADLENDNNVLLAVRIAKAITFPIADIWT